MKKNDKFPVTEKSILSQIERLDNKGVDHRLLELKAKRKIANNPLIQKNINFLHTYNNLFKKSHHYYLGDANNLFKNSLRNYNDSFDILKELNLEGVLKDSQIKRKKKQRSQYLTQHHEHHCEDNQNLQIKGIFNQKNHQEKAEEEEEEEDAKNSEPEEEFQKELLIVSPPILLEKTDNSTESEDFNPELLPEELILNEPPIPINLSSSSSDEETDDLSSIKETLKSLYKMAEEFGNEDMDLEMPIEEDEAEGEDDDELKDVEEMIKQASEELQKVAEENEQMMETLDEEGDEEEGLVKVTEPEKSEAEAAAKPSAPPPADAGDSVFKFDPKIDSAILKELEAAEKQARKTASVINALKTRVGELLLKDKMSEAEAKELEEKNGDLKQQMLLFEEKTKRIQFLLAQANLFDKMQPVQPQLQQKYREDILPKMLVCGSPDAFMPKIVLCHERTDPNKQRSRSPSKERRPSKKDQEIRYQSSAENKDRTVECLQKQLCSLQNEMNKMVCQENAKKLNDQQTSCANPSCPKNTRSNSPPPPSTTPSNKGGKMSCGPGRGLCPADVENRLEEYSNTTNQLEKQLIDVEHEVKSIQQELIDVQIEREHLEHHRKMLALKPPCGLPFCPPFPPPCGGYPPCPPDPSSGEDQQYKELKEKYARLQEDFKAKLTEVAGLRADNEKLRELAEKAEESRSKLELKVKELEKKIKELRGDSGDKGTGSKEQLIDLQQQLKVHKELYRQAQDELEELRALVEDIQGQLNDYRNKYLEAIQTVEEQRRQIEIMRLENNRISEQVNLEIIRVKNQFQEKLQELAPLPDILKATQMKLQEAQQMHLLAERNNEAMARELQTYKDKLKEILDEMALADSARSAGAGEKETLAQRLKDLERMVQEGKDENDELRIEMERLREIAEENERLANEKLHEIVQLETQLESVREESARQVSRIKDRCEIVRKSTQNQVNDLERQLAQTKALAKAAERDRDEIRQKMQAQIGNLNENFEDAQMRIRNLQGHVNFLKNSYVPVSELNTTNAENTKKPAPKMDPCCCAANY